MPRSFDPNACGTVDATIMDAMDQAKTGVPRCATKAKGLFTDIFKGIGEGVASAAVNVATNVAKALKDAEEANAADEAARAAAGEPESENVFAHVTGYSWVS